LLSAICDLLLPICARRLASRYDRIESGKLELIAQGDTPVVALDAVDLKIAAGEFLAITGEYGSGKSTLLHLWDAWTNRTVAKS